MKEVKVLRLGHRPSRDKRLTTHVGLVARALGADGIILDEKDPKIEKSIIDVAGRFGGDFSFGVEEKWRKLIKNWSGKTIHLSMYGQKIQELESELRKITDRLLIILGSEKVPGEVYEIADYNVAVTNQPHSEVAALAILLDRLYEGKKLEEEFDGELKIIPSEEDKIVKEKD
ncbi:tRNA (cytidine(56)-2'-O)-methyltransferase [archaeon SCG-AAA382B04]|nr:tRNA (cytidine(56)-2'-O)-methyltransferase [archaeon SCG-AAA382B04]